MVFRFLAFELDVERRQLRARGEPVAIAPKAFDVLCYLVMNRDRMVSKTELLDAFWSRNVSDTALHKTISVMRKAIAIESDAGHIVQTQHGRGFRFMPEVEEIDQRTESHTKEEAAPLKEQRLVAVLCVRLRLAAESSEAVQRYLDKVRPVINAHQGELLRAIKDGFTAEFGLSHGQEDGARRAAHCAVDLAKFIERDQITCGIDFGVIEFDTNPGSGDKTRQSPVEQGAMEYAAAAEFEEILLSEDTQRQLGSEVRTKSTAGGHLLIAIERLGPGIPGRPLKRPTQFVGRVAEMAFLSSCIDTLEMDNGQVVMLSGPAGIGKTRLTSEFLASLEAGPYRIIEIQCLPALGHSPLSTIREICLALFSEDLQSSLTDDVEIALLDDLLGTRAQSGKSLAHLSEHQRRQRGYALVSRLLRSACEDQPVVMVIEDVHWMDATSREYFEAIHRDIDGIRLCIVTTTRPVEGLCCTNPVRDSSHESSVVAGMHEQTDTTDLQDQELASL